jgi:predicted AlkP superfamily pyrophosphatase or phosphodiesterase
MHKTVVINAVGLSPSLIGEHTPRIAALQQQGGSVPLQSMLPAVTCSVQSTYLTGVWPSMHGIVGNGWYYEHECEVKFWRQSNKLVQAQKVWDMAREYDPGFSCSNMFWWYNMYSTVDVSATPRPMYPSDGRKLPDIYTVPAQERDLLQKELGQFPLFKFWGPTTSIDSSNWIAQASILVDGRHDPSLTLIYLPHLDYCLQKVGPGDPSVSKDLAELDGVVGNLIDHYQSQGARIVLLSEYGIVPVSRPVHLNRHLRAKGFISIREELGLELLDCGASTAFAVADHQVAHVYINDLMKTAEIRALLESVEGVSRVYSRNELKQINMDHTRSGDFVVLAEEDTWFTYYYWDDDARAPDFARTVDIHRKPGYDPVEMFMDPSIPLVKLKAMSKLLKKKLGFRTLMDVIPLDASLIKGSHGVPPSDPANGPVFISSEPSLLPDSGIQATDVCSLMLKHLGFADAGND